MKSFWTVVLLFTLGCGLGATGNYDFSTKAQYSADKSGLLVSVNAQGYVPRHADAGNGQSIGTIVSTSTGDTIFFETNTSLKTTLICRDKSVQTDAPIKVSEAIVLLFEDIGLKQFDKNEINELGEILTGTTSGPKMTSLRGQTKFVEVIEVETERK